MSGRTGGEITSVWPKKLKPQERLQWISAFTLLGHGLTRTAHTCYGRIIQKLNAPLPDALFKPQR